MWISGTKVSKIQHLQNAAAKLIVGTKMRDHVTAILNELHMTASRKWDNI